MFSIEKNIPLAESKLWQAQRKFFEQEGINAWQGYVPFFVTSNPFIAESYANLITAYLKDLLSQKVLDLKEPLYILELGTGPGQFSFYCLKALQRLLTTPEFKDLTLCYVMTDFTESNIRFWESHKLLQPFLVGTQLKLDFAKFDFDSLEPIVLRHQNKKLETLKNPCIVIGNYIFDSVRQNYFSLEHGALFAQQIETLVPFKDYDQQTQSILSLKEVKIEERPISCDWSTLSTREQPYLQFYETHLQSGLFGLPLGGFDALDFINIFAPQGFMLISSDKGYNSLKEIETRKKLELVTHGSLSLDVNFHALALYFEFLGGSSKLQTYRDGIKTNVFLSRSFNTPYLDQAFSQYCDGFAPADYFYYHRRFRDTQELELNAVLTQLHLSRFDPYVFSLMTDKICEALKKHSYSEVLIDSLSKMILKLYENIYPFEKGMDHYFNLGLVLHTLQRYPEACLHYQASLDHYGKQFANLYNSGLCQYSLGNYAKAKEYFTQALPFDTGKEQRAQIWLKETEKHL